VFGFEEGGVADERGPEKLPGASSLAVGLSLEEVAKLKEVENAAVPELSAFELVTVTRVDGSPMVVKWKRSSRRLDERELVDG
jgi:hypothetical protein